VDTHSSTDAVDAEMVDNSPGEMQGQVLPTHRSSTRPDEVITTVDDTPFQTTQVMASQASEHETDSNVIQRSETESHPLVSIAAPTASEVDMNDQQAPDRTELGIQSTPKNLSLITKNTTDPQASSASAVTTSAQSDNANQEAATDIDPIHTTAMTPQEITLAELKAQKAALLASLAALPAIRVLMEENASSNADMSDGEDEPTETDIMVAANKMVKDHIKLLHEYNELKDVGQGLMGLIADQRGVRIIEVQEEFGVDAND